MNELVTIEQINAVQEMTGHSVYGGSSLPRIVSCPACVGMELKAGLQPESIYAKKGTELHTWSEKAMRSSNPTDYLLAQDIEIEDTALLIDSVDYVEKIIDLHPDGSYTIGLEAKGSLSSYGLPEVYGTMDVVIISANRIDVIDYKYGFGVPNYAKKNYQLVSYLAMAVPFIEVPPSDVDLHVHICQPPKQIFDDWQLDYATMYQMVLGDITDAIGESRTANPRFGPSEKACRFCKANMRCVERHSYLRKQANLIHQMSKDPSRVSNQQWSDFLEGWASLKAAAKNVEGHAISEIMSGHDFPNYKLVSGKANRKFKDQEEGEKFIRARLGNKAFKFKEPPVITLAQAEKFDKKLKTDNEWKDMIYKPEGSAQLVKADAKGKAMTFGVRSIMDDIAAEDSNKG